MRPDRRIRRASGGDGSSYALAASTLPAIVFVPAVSSPGGVHELLSGAGGWLAYVAVFVLAATPWLEVLLVVPPAIGFGLNPVLVGVLAFLGNVLPIYLIVVVHGRIVGWLERRRDGDEPSSTRWERAGRLFDRYGLPGLALAAPIATGVHLATVIALLLDAPPRAVVAWMTASFAIWTAALVVGSVVGLELLGFA